LETQKILFSWRPEKANFQ